MPIKKPELVIFDMDGTMLDTEVLSIKGWEVAVAEQIPNFSRQIFLETFHKMIGTNYESCRRIARELMPHFDFDKGYKVSYDYMDEYIKNYGVPVKPGLFALLDKLDEMKIKKCVATSTNKGRAAHKLELANLAHRFDVIVGGDEVAASKPAPDIFLKAANVCGVAPENCLVLEDSAAGAEGGFRAGMQVIVIPDLLQPSEETRKIANAVCKSLGEVAALIST
jgi:HAD superfamily hydrolase (TIGR01509 family)